MRKKMYVGHFKRTTGPGQYTLIPHLSATLCIKRCPVKNHQAFPALVDRFDFSIIHHERQDRCAVIKTLIASKVCPFLNADLGDAFHAELTRSAGPVPLTRHCLFKAFHIHT